MTITTPSNIKTVPSEAIESVIKNMEGKLGPLYMFALASIDRISVISEIQKRESL